MVIGGKEYKIGDHIRTVSVKSVLHYEYGMEGDIDEDMNGLTGIIVSESSFKKDAVCNLKLDEPYVGTFENGMTRLFKDDEIELICN